MTCHTSGGQKDILPETVVSFCCVSSQDLAQVLGLAASPFIHWAVLLAPILIFIYVCVCAHVLVSASGGKKSPGDGVTGSCGSRDMGSRNQMPVFWKDSKDS